MERAKLLEILLRAWCCLEWQSSQFCKFDFLSLIFETMDSGSYFCRLLTLLNALRKFLPDLSYVLSLLGEIE